ncbi:hypothetical protein, partial [Bacillus coahuilensis]|uniref:hypothetical protein n=1 Tax=Bacillus coahuilensis TaxID=408580 RepID=UPI0019D3D1EB
LHRARLARRSSPFLLPFSAPRRARAALFLLPLPLFYTALGSRGALLASSPSFLHRAGLAHLAYLSEMLFI